MSKIIIAVACLAVFSCGAGKMGEKGEQGVQGQAGTAKVVCKDATGTLVSESPDCLYVDVTGVQWRVDTETGKPVSGALTTIYYVGSDCSGDGYVSPPPPPRIAFQLTGETTFRVRPDTLASALSPALSGQKESNGCSTTLGGKHLSVKLQDILNTTPLTAPTLTFVAPLHLEFVK